MKTKKQNNGTKRKKTGIYKLTNPKGEVYIGQAIDIHERFSKYRGLHVKSQPKIYNSLLKHGYEAHKKEILEECYISQLPKREAFHKRKFIKKHGWGKALFCHIKDGKGGYQSKETRLKKSISMTGKKASIKTREKMRKSKINHPMFNANWRKIMKETAWKSGTNSKIIYQYDKQGNFIREWKSITEASKTLNISKAGISNNLCGLAKSAGGYGWKYK